MTKVDWREEREAQGTYVYQQNRTNRQLENSIKALRATDPAYDAICAELEAARPVKKTTV